MLLLRAFVALALVSLCVSRSRAQGIDSVIVEPYQVTPVDGGAPLVTWRIYVDMAQGHRLHMVYGEQRNELVISTTTSFFNDTVNGEAYAHRINAASLNEGALALDSWLTIDAASDGHVGVPRSLDTDGSMLQCPPYPGPQELSTLRRDHPPALCAVDGLIARDSIPEVVEFRMSTSYLSDKQGAILHTMDGAWGVLGGVKGDEPDNIVLIAQITTSGPFTYRMNVQLGGPDRSIVRYVSGEAHRENEHHHPGLRGVASWPGP